MHHTFAYAKTIASAAEADVTPVPDGIERINNGHFVPAMNRYLMFGMAAGLLLVRARLITPSFRQITTPWIRPLMLGPTLAAVPNIADYRATPLLCRQSEEVQLATTNSAATSGVYVGVFGWSSQSIVPSPAGDVYTMRITSATAAVATTWTLIAATYQDSLPTGRYAVIGLNHFSTTALAARLTFVGQVDRPGCISQVLATDQPHPMFSKGGLGVWGTFQNDQPPNIEVFCGSTDATHELYMDLVRVG